MTTITLEQLTQCGACKEALETLAGIYGSDGTITLHPSELAGKLDKVFALWGMKLMTRARQEALVTAWYNRALTTDPPSWKAAVLALLGGVEADIEAAITARHAEMQAADTSDPRDPTGLAVAGLGWAVARLAKAYVVNAQEAYADATLARLKGVFDWALRLTVARESVSSDSVWTDFTSAVYTDLDTNGVELPPLPPPPPPEG